MSASLICGDCGGFMAGYHDVFLCVCGAWCVGLGVPVKLTPAIPTEAEPTVCGRSYGGTWNGLRWTWPPSVCQLAPNHPPPCGPKIRNEVPGRAEHAAVESTDETGRSTTPAPRGDSPVEAPACGLAYVSVHTGLPLTCLRERGHGPVLNACGAALGEAPGCGYTCAERGCPMRCDLPVRPTHPFRDCACSYHLRRAPGEAATGMGAQLAGTAFCSECECIAGNGQRGHHMVYAGGWAAGAIHCAFCPHGSEPVPAEKAFKPGSLWTTPATHGTGSWSRR